MIDITINPNTGKIQGKVLNITHNDLDGVVSSIVLVNAFDDVTIEHRTYYNINSFLNEASSVANYFNIYDYIVITDFNLSPPISQKLFSIMASNNYQGQLLILDHHESALYLHDPSQNFYVIPNISAAMLTYEYITKLIKVDLSYLFNMVYLANDYDMWIHKNTNSKKLNLILEYYMEEDKTNGFLKFINDFKSGIDFNNLTKKVKDIIILKEGEIENEWNTLGVDMVPGYKIAIISTQRKYINEMCDRLLNGNYNIDVVINVNPNSTTANVRASSRIKNMDLSKVIETIFDNGGGHKLAAGFRYPDIRNNEVTEKMNIIQKHIKKFTDALAIVYPELKV